MPYLHIGRHDRRIVRDPVCHLSAAAARAPQAAFARSDTLGFLRLVRLLTLRRRQAGIVRGFRRFAEPCFKLGNPPLGRFKTLPQRPDQGILLGVTQVVEVGKLEHPRLESTRPWSCQSIS